MTSADATPAKAPGYRRYVLAAAILAAAALAYVLRGVLVPLFFAFLSPTRSIRCRQARGVRYSGPWAAVLVMLSWLSSGC